MKSLRNVAFLCFMILAFAGAEQKVFADLWAFQQTYDCSSHAWYQCPEQIPANWQATCDPGEGGGFCTDGWYACQEFCSYAGVDQYDCWGSGTGYVYCNCNYLFCG